MTYAFLTTKGFRIDAVARGARQAYNKILTLEAQKVRELTPRQLTKYLDVFGYVTPYFHKYINGGYYEGSPVYKIKERQ